MEAGKSSQVGTPGGGVMPTDRFFEYANRCSAIAFSRGISPLVWLPLKGCRPINSSWKINRRHRGVVRSV